MTKVNICFSSACVLATLKAQFQSWMLENAGMLCMHINCSGSEVQCSCSAGTGAEAQGPKMWEYRDPQGKVQGPFKSSQMAEWINADFFAKDLPVSHPSELSACCMHNMSQAGGSGCMKITL